MKQRSQPNLAYERIMAAIARTDREAAIALASEALDAGDEQPLVLMLEAERLDEEGKPLDALALLERALNQDEDEPELWRRYGCLLAKTGRLIESLDAFDEALDLTPDHRFVLIAAGEASYRAGLLRRSLMYYERADALAPGQPDVLAAISAVHAGLQDSARAREMGRRALALAPHNMTAILALARSDLLEGDHQAALNRVLPLIDGHPEARISLVDIAGEAFDALGLTREAFAAYSARNAALDRLHSAAIRTQFPERRVEQAKRITQWLRARHSEPWPEFVAAAASPARGHLFVLGFPRSGTTLLEKSLAGHPQIVTLPEIDLVSGPAATFIESAEGLDRLLSAAPDVIQDLRAGYWSQAAQLVGDRLGEKVLVDKLPLHTLALPVIARLFPQARIIFAVRDPRDIVLSCFRRRFQLNSAMYEFLSLDRVAAFYVAVMELAEAAAAVLPLHLLEVRHESVVSDFDLSIGRILGFADLHWDDGVRGFSELAKVNPRTPSDVQLARGLSSEGVGQWRRYSAQLKPVIPSLEPWTRRFGYPAE